MSFSPGFATALVHSARSHPQRPAVIHAGGTVDHRSFNERVNRLANGLAALGLEPGDAVAALMTARVEMLEAYWATAKAGLVFVPVNAMLQAAEIAAIVALAGVRCMLVDDELRGQVPAGLPGVRVLRVGGHAGDYEALLGSASSGEPAVPVDGESICTIMFSSGTTSRPKGIVNTHRARAMACHIYAAEFGLTFESRTLLATPLYHNSALILALPTMAVGGCVVLERRFEPARTMACWERHAVTHALLVPTQLRRMLADPALRSPLPASTRCVVSVGESLPEPVRLQTLERLTPHLYTMYGISEGLATVLRPEMQATRGGSVGTPVLHTEIRIVDDAGAPVPAGTVGEVIGRSVRMMQGYFRDEAATAAALRGDWLHTGDLGRIDAHGVLSIVGRKKDIVISGGVNIYPIDIERVVARHPGVHEAAVVGVPDEAWGESVKLVVAPKPGCELSPQALDAWCREHLPAYQRPRYIEVRAALPRNATGKVMKQELIASPEITGTDPEESKA